MRKWFNEVGKLKCHSILLHTRKSRISVKVISSPKQTADKDYLLFAAWKNVNSFSAVKMIFRTLGDNLWVAWPAVVGCKCFCLTWECIFATKYCLQQSSIAANTTSHVAQGQCSTASHAGTHFWKFAPDYYDESGLQIVWDFKKLWSSWRDSRSGSRWQGSDWTLLRSWLAILRRRHTRSATETRTSCRQD